MNPRIALFLLPRPLDSFILQDFVRPLTADSGVEVLEPGRMPAGALMRLPKPLAAAEAARQARRVKINGDLGVVVLMHPVQWPLAKALLDRNPGAELWYGIWDRYDCAPDADARTRARVGAMHAAASARADWRFAVSGALADLEREAGRDCDVLPPPHDAFPAPDPTRAIVAASMGHLGRRTDWALLNRLVTDLPELTLLLIGEVHADETPDDKDLKDVLAAANVVCLGSLPDEAAARVISLADVCLLPFREDEFNDTGLPQRILKAAKVGRRTLVPPLKGPLTQSEAVTVCSTPTEWTAALRSAGEANHVGDRDLRAWALSQNEEKLLAPFREKLRGVGI
ncbi:MAG: hypothetical protein NTY57_02855 [Solirubrobacterales bacterium]|nr:hypothetical protein [Solirubrobacterales bacterium]